VIAVLALLPIAFVLALDNFQSSVGLGTTKPSWIRIVQCALLFGVFDAVAPAIGVWVGGYIGDYIGESAEYIGAAALLVYGTYLVVHAIRTEPNQEKFDHPLAILGLPLPLSLDNLLAGAGLGVIGYSAVTVALVAGSVTTVMSLAGLTIGKFAANKVPIRTDLFGGVVIMALACFMAVRA
jgi:putative Mn2+ efflux pump MntP